MLNRSHLVSRTLACNANLTLAMNITGEYAYIMMKMFPNQRTNYCKKRSSSRGLFVCMYLVQRTADEKVFVSTSVS